MTRNELHRYNAELFWHPMAGPADMKAHKPIVIHRASGVEVEDIDGHKTVDGVGGLWCVNLGYSNDAVKEAINRQLQDLPYYNCFRGTSNSKAIELSLLLTGFFEAEGMARAFYTSGGSESVETALRLARQFHKLAGAPEKTKFISLRSGYHGTNFGGGSVTGMARFHRAYGPMLPGCFHIPSPWTYRNPWNESDPEQLAALCAGALEAEIRFQDSDTVAAFIVEPVIGSGGVIPPHESFMPKVREICDRYGVLLIADEVITGFGRTGAWCGSRLWGVKPDVMTLAKGITSGYVPFGAVMLSEEIAKVFEGESGPIAAVSTGYTYSGHPVGAAAAIAAITEAKRLQVAENARIRGEEMLAAFEALRDKYDIVGDVRGKGLMLAIELVSDRGARTPLDRNDVQKIFAATYRAGAMVRVSGNMLIVSPPLIVTAEHVQRIVDCIDAGLASV
jgi:putrescine---pyruvate transaminase